METKEVTKPQLSEEDALKLLQEAENERLTKANQEILEVCKKYNITLQPRIIIDIIPNK